MTVATSPLLRWSSARVCGRKAIYEATDAAARERSDREHRILYRGRSLGRDYGDWLAARDGQDSILREVKVEWPLGIGHIDLVHLPTSTAIEVLSSAHASDAMVQSKLLQLVGYLEHYEAAEHGLLVVLNPSDFTEERFPVARGTDAYDHLVEQMHERIAELERWRDERVIPARVCAKPSEAIGRFCLHAEHCFNDEPAWAPPRPEDVHAGVEAQQAADRVFHLKLQELEAKGVYDAAVAERKDAEAELGELVEDAGTFVVGPWFVTRSDVQMSARLDVRKAELAGALNVEALSEFYKPGAAYSKWKVERAEFPDQPAAEYDFGDEAPF